MADIREFPELNELENQLAELFKRSAAEAVEAVPELADEVRSLKLNEIIIFASWANDNATIGGTQLSLGFIIDVPEEILPDRDPTEIDTFINARNLLGEIINEQEIDWDLFNDYFDGFDLDMAFIQNRTDFVIFKLNITDSNLAYSLTDDLDIRVTEGEPQFPGGPPTAILEEREAGARVPIEEPPEIEEGVAPNDILEYPELSELGIILESSFNEALMLSEDYNEEDADVDRIIVDAPWGDGTAEYGIDTLGINYLVSTDIEDIRFRVFGSSISDIVENILEPTELMMEWFDGMRFDILKTNQVDLSLIIQNTQSNRLYDILNDETLRVEDGQLITDVIEEAEEPEPVEEVEPPPEPEEPEVEAPPEFPEIPDPLRPYAVSPDRIEIPAGKETRSLEPRAIYNWEIELASPQGEINGGIGQAMRQGGDEDEPTFGVGIAPGTFPRTGAYIKQHLLNEGPSYVLQIYNDLVIYSAFISSLYTGEFRTGKYDSFRAYINRIKLIPERGGPQLINLLSPQQVSALGLESLADHPNIEGEKAPWLERRNYYEIIEENADHEAWNNITEFVAQLTEQS